MHISGFCGRKDSWKTKPATVDSQIYANGMQRATLLTTNKAFGEWNEVFPNAACVVSLIDRLVHHSEIIAIEGMKWTQVIGHWKVEVKDLFSV